MKFEEALAALREGKSVRLGPCKCGIIKSEGNDNAWDHNNQIVSFGLPAMLSEDWEIVE